MKSCVLTALALVAAPVLGHTGAFARGMYCRNGASNVDSPNTNTVVNPLYGLAKKDWWMQADRGCPNYPPPAGEFLELPVGKTFTVELAFNRAFTTLSYGGKSTSDWPDGKDHPADWNGFAEDPGEGCLQGAGGALHVQNEGNATGTVFAISYNSDLSKVTMENLVVFTVAEHTPWKRVTSYQVPKDLPPCPPGGCHCAYGWAPNGCGQRNVYLQPFKCDVTGSTSTKQVAEAKPPVYCKDDASKCTKGAKQVIIFAQLEGNNVTPLPGKSPGYNSAWGFPPGAQNDIYVDGPVSPASASAISYPSASALASSAVTAALGRPTSVTSLASTTKSSSEYEDCTDDTPSAAVSAVLPYPSSIAASATYSGYSASKVSEIALVSSDDGELCDAPPNASVSVYPPVIKAPSASAVSGQAYESYSAPARQPVASYGSVPPAAISAAASPWSYASNAASTFSTVASSAVPSIARPSEIPSSRPRPVESEGTQAEMQKFKKFIDSAWARWLKSHNFGG